MGNDEVKDINATSDAETGTLKRIFQDRKRTNILSNPEQATISYLVKRVPNFISSNMLTVIGTAGSFLVLFGFILATYLDRSYLLLGILGLAINIIATFQESGLDSHLTSLWTG
jgi:hypothetical protein